MGYNLFMPKASSDRTAQDRWTDEVLKAGFTIIPSALVIRQRQLGLKAVDVNILLHLISAWWRKESFPRLSKQTIAKRMGIDPSTVQRRVRAMESAGLVKRIRRTGKKKADQTNAYDLTPLVERLKIEALHLLDIRAKRQKEAQE